MSTASAPSNQRGGRYQRSMAGMVGAMVVVVLAAIGYAVLNWLNGGQPDHKVATVDYHPWAASARADRKLQAFVPSRLPSGWRATSATYTPGSEPQWHLGMLAKGGGYVGVEESFAHVDDLVGLIVDKNATRHGSQTLAGTTWQVWSDSGGDYALVRQLPARLAGQRETLLVGGSASAAKVRALAATLSSTAR